VVASPPANPPKVSAIIPIYGRLGNVAELIERLKQQTAKPHEIILVESGSAELKEIPPGVHYFRNPLDLALSGDYNLGAEKATGDYLLLMQQDCLPSSNTDLEENLRLLTPGRVAVSSSVTLPAENWERYSFWGQALMARWVGTFKQGISGKFDLIRADVFRRIGGYDTRTFSFAGEDMDLCMRLSEHGEVFVASTQVIHLHNQSQNTRCRDLFKKTYQLAESFGALIRKWGFGLQKIPYASHVTHHFAKYLYPLLPFCLVFPKYVAPVLFLLANFNNVEVWRIRSPKKFVFLVVNPALFLVSAAGTLKGFITGKQRYSVNR
jgi:glycosyltransferase involved in cell wall biosynthesis